MPRTCNHCHHPLPETASTRRHYCDERCSRAAFRNSRTTTCSQDGCERPMRARGLCSPHYNTATRKPNPTVTVQCQWCGGDAVKERAHVNRYSTIHCSTACRDQARRNAGPTSELPQDHWARWYGTTSTWRQPEPSSLPARFTGGTCVDCGESFIAETHGSPITYCSRLCLRRVERRRRRARETNAPGSYRWSEVMRQYQRQGNVCAYCHQHRGIPEPDHHLALSRGGRNDMSNIVAACKPCNSSKSDMTIPEWNAFRTSRGLEPIRFDPTAKPYLHLAHYPAQGTSHRLAAA